MESFALAQQLYPTLREVPWEGNFDLQVQTTLLYLLGWGPSSKEMVYLRKNVSGLIGLGKGLGSRTIHTLPLEFVFLWSTLRAGELVDIPFAVLARYKLLIEPPIDRADVLRALEDTQRLREHGFHAIPAVGAFIKKWRMIVNCCYAYATIGEVAIDEAPTDLAEQVYAPLQLAWQDARLNWEAILAERAQAQASKRGRTYARQAK